MPCWSGTTHSLFNRLPAALKFLPPTWKKTEHVWPNGLPPTPCICVSKRGCWYIPSLRMKIVFFKLKQKASSQQLTQWLVPKTQEYWTWKMGRISESGPSFTPLTQSQVNQWTERIRQSKSLSGNCTIKSQPTFHLDGSLVMPLITGDWCNNSWPAFSKQLHNMQTPPVALQKWIPTTY